MTRARLWQRAARGVVGYFQRVGHFSINIRLLFPSSVLSGIAQGKFGVNFNLYILSLGIQPDELGRILSAGPLAHAVAGIPMGFLGELFGLRFGPRTAAEAGEIT